ncbi:hypothetical protein [Streptomyces sp. NPDC049887]|uniref:hypothetical protein n=1 Tax=Streptomyces sp. NPDC049887 TaxID=3155654 RepID=UPI00344054AF
MKASSAWPVYALALLPFMLSSPVAHGETGEERNGADRQNVETITVVSKSVGSPVSPGHSADLFDEKGNRIGFSATSCSPVSSMPTTVLCHGSYVLDGKGEITWENANRGQATPYFTAVTGGTGRYCEARGQIRVIRTQSQPGGGLSQLKVFLGRKCPVSA